MLFWLSLIIFIIGIVMINKDALVSNYKNKNQKILKYKQFFRFIIANKKIHNFLGHIL